MNRELMPEWAKCKTAYDHLLLWDVCPNPEQYAWAKEGCLDFQMEFRTGKLSIVKRDYDECVMNHKKSKDASEHNYWADYWIEQIHRHETLVTECHVTAKEWWHGLKTGKIIGGTSLGIAVARGLADQMIDALNERDTERQH